MQGQRQANPEPEVKVEPDNLSSIPARGGSLVQDVYCRVLGCG